MTSQINYNNIDAAYPVAGQDNDSQGFRDNFNAIKTALTTASVEITNLQAYTAKRTDPTTDFLGNQVTGALLVNNASFVKDTSQVRTNQDAYSVYAAVGDYQIFQVNTNTTFVVDQWFPGTETHKKYQKIRLEITPMNTDWSSKTSTTTITLNFAPLGVDGSIRQQAGALPWTSATPARSIWDIWSYDGGATQFVQFVGTWT